MTMRVPFLPEQSIERDAEMLLGEYMVARRVAMEPPVPIDDITEKYLKLTIEFDDTHRLFGLPRPHPDAGPDILGAIYFNSHRIVVDQSLDPEEKPESEPRYRFTLAHEAGGHWRLHRPLFDKNWQQGSFLVEQGPSVLCRSSKAKEQIEWQADFYASCLLMPKAMVLAAWCQRFGNLNPQILKVRNRATAPDRSVFENMERHKQEQLIREFVRPFAQKFQVSVTAMRIRLEKLGLLLRDVASQQSLAVGQ